MGRDPGATARRRTTGGSSCSRSSRFDTGSAGSPGCAGATRVRTQSTTPRTDRCGSSAGDCPTCGPSCAGVCSAAWAGPCCAASSSGCEPREPALPSSCLAAWPAGRCVAARRPPPGSPTTGGDRRSHQRRTVRWRAGVPEAPRRRRLGVRRALISRASGEGRAFRRARPSPTSVPAGLRPNGEAPALRRPPRRRSTLLARRLLYDLARRSPPAPGRRRRPRASSRPDAPFQQLAANATPPLAVGLQLGAAPRPTAPHPGCAPPPRDAARSVARTVSARGGQPAEGEPRFGNRPLEPVAVRRRSRRCRRPRAAVRRSRRTRPRRPPGSAPPARPDRRAPACRSPGSPCRRTRRASPASASWVYASQPTADLPTASAP